uniref:interleukin-5 receptor subunit alpha-like isoform X3 n=1 Tax=Pristiophorus japonicus TaxID=55135 RepID=UPI00398E3BE6
MLHTSLLLPLSSNPIRKTFCSFLPRALICHKLKKSHYVLPLSIKSWKSRTVKIHQKELDLEFHRGLFAKVKLLGNDEHNSNIPDYWTEKIFDPPRDLFASINNLSCIFYDNNYMNCTWDINKETPQGAQYFLSYRQTNEDTVTNCTNYHKDGQRNVACYGHKYEIDSIDEVNICVSESSNKTTLPFCRKMHPAGFYKLYTPINVTINENTDEVKWKLPKGNVNSSCYIYEIKITNRSNRGSIQNVENLTGGKYVISRDQKKKYSVQVRGKVVFECYESIFWSDWSKPLIIEPNSTGLSVLTIAILVTVIFVVIVLLLVFICTKCKLLSKICQPVPDPKEKFKDLFEDCNGDFQKWINKNPLLMTKTEDCIPASVKEV